VAWEDYVTNSPVFLALHSMNFTVKLCYRNLLGVIFKKPNHFATYIIESIVVLVPIFMYF